jgi:hypothetical protein
MGHPHSKELLQLRVVRCLVKRAKKAPEQPVAYLVRRRPQAHKAAQPLAPRQLQAKGCPVRRVTKEQARLAACLARQLLPGPRVARLLAPAHRAPSRSRVSNAERQTNRT